MESRIRDDFPEYQRVLLDDRFKIMNIVLKEYSFEIKSVILKDSNGEMTRYHGLANVAEDAVAMEYGSRFSSGELKLFFDIAIKILENKFLSTADIARLDSRKITQSELEHLLDRLHAEGWLSKNSDNYWVLGVRTYIELQPQLEEAILESPVAKDDDRPQELRLQELKQLARTLPQILLY